LLHLIENQFFKHLYSGFFLKKGVENGDQLSVQKSFYRGDFCDSKRRDFSALLGLTAYLSHLFTSKL